MLDEEGLLNCDAVQLKNILVYAYKNVPFYSQRLEEAGIILGNDVKLDEFQRLPLLTKADIRNNIEELTSRNIYRRKWFYNSTSGSTGEPIRFIQDEWYNKWSNATERYYYENIVGIDELSAKKSWLWGSARDVYAGTISLRAKITNWLMNREFLNSYKMSAKLNIPVSVAKSNKETVEDADIVLTATWSKTPTFSGDWIKPGTHINGIGSYTPEMQEVDVTTVKKAKIVVDSYEASFSEAGDLITPLKNGDITKEHIYAELGELVIGQKEGRTLEEEITFFKSVGMAIQDASAAKHAYLMAKKTNIGLEISF